MTIFHLRRMTISSEQALKIRSQHSCELCSSLEDLSIYPIPPNSDLSAQQCLYICQICRTQIEGQKALDSNHWHCLNDSMWKAEPAIQVIAYRILHQLLPETWAQNALDMLYLEPDVQTWAEQIMTDDESNEPTFDSHGTELKAGDYVTLIKDLKVKGAHFTAKQGTLVRNISLTDNPKHIEGKINGTRIVLIAAYLKKASTS
jgi:protein PhnA